MTAPLTIFAIPRAFTGPYDAIQRNAIGSWTRLASDVRVVLFGDDAGTAEAARELGVSHVPGIATNAAGTPLLSDAFEQAHRVSAGDGVLCYANADIVLLDDFVAAVQAATSRPRPFLLVGQVWDVDLDGAIDFDAGWQAKVRAGVSGGGLLRMGAGIDYFAFSPGLLRALPPFAVGRGTFDNWLLWHARRRGGRVIDATAALCAVHQSHDYSHVAGVRSFEEVMTLDEAKGNRRLAGATRKWYTVANATHGLRDGRVRRARGPRYRAARREELRRVLSVTLPTPAGRTRRLWRQHW